MVFFKVSEPFLNMEELEAQPKSMKSLLSKVNEGGIVIPEFQRDFVWKPSNTIALIISVLKGYPAGNLLFWNFKNDKAKLEYRNIIGVEKESKNPSFLVLDGQQRLTALYGAFYGKGTHEYFLDLGKLASNDFDEDGVLAYTQKKVDKLELDKISKQFELKLYPLKAIFNQDNGYEKDWKMEYIKQLKEERKDPYDFIEWFEKIEKKYFVVIRGYKFAVTELPANMPMDAVCQIFESLNSTGMSLGAFELLTARLYAEDIKLRDLWDNTNKESALIKEFEIKPTEILKAISLTRTKDDPSCKRKDILELESKEFKLDWDNAVARLEKSLGILKSECGVLSKKWLPYSSLLAPMTALLQEVELSKGAKEAEINSKIQRWFWCSVFNRTYDASTDTRAMKDYKEMLIWIKGGSEPETIKNFHIDEIDLFSTTQQSDAVYKGIISLVVKNGAKDFHNGIKIDTQILVKENIDDHHIFQKAYLQTKKTESSLINSILNKTLISSDTNKRIGGKKPPSSYFKEIEESMDVKKLDNILKSHLIIRDSRKALNDDDFDAFLKERASILIEKIKEVTS